MRLRDLIGILIIALGILFLLESFGLMSFHILLAQWWPLIVIAIGLVHLTRHPHTIFLGLTITVVGLLLQASMLNKLPIPFWSAFFPLIIIIAGVAVLTKSYRHSRFVKGMTDKRTSSSDRIEMETIFSGSQQKISSDNFKGGNLSVLFGGATLDMRGSAIVQSDPVILDVNVMFGGLELIVPPEWRVETSGSPVLGGIDNKCVVSTDSNAPLLKVNYFVMFGGIEIRNRKHKEF